MRRREGHAPRRLSARVLLSRHSAHRAPRWSVTVVLVGFSSYAEHPVGESAVVHSARERFACPVSQLRSTRGAERTSALGVRAQIADGVRGPRADASESKCRAVRAAPCLSPHVTHSLACRFLRGGAGPCSPAASQRTIP